MEEKIAGFWKRRYGDVELHGLSAFVLAGLFLLQSVWSGFSFSCLLASLIFAGAGAAVLRLRRSKRDKDDLKIAEVDLLGLSGFKFSGSDIAFKWTDLSVVRFSESKKGKSSVEFSGKGIRAVISQDSFENFSEIREALKRRVPRKRVKVEEKEIDGPEKALSEVEQSPLIIKDRASSEPKQLFYYVMGTAYVALLIVVFMGWGTIEGCVVSGAIWCVILAAWIYSPKLLPTKRLGEIRFTQAGAIGTTFAGRKKEINWKDVLNVVIHFPPSAGGWQRHAGRIVINGEDVKLPIGLQFPKFGMIASHLNEICINRGIRVYTTGSPIVAHRPLEEAEKKKMEKMLGLEEDKE